MTNNPIPMIEARGGTYREVGKQIGEQARHQIHSMLAYLRENVPAGFSWEQMLKHSHEFLTPSRAVYPQYVEELEGIAEGAGVPFEDIFLSMCEELWESPVLKGCTDMAARGRATLDGTTLIAHTNDLSLKWIAFGASGPSGDEPEILAVSPAVAISAGYNAARISLTGNQLDSNDTRPGVPRLLVVRAILGSRTLSEAMTHCLLPERASSYNNVLADASGEVYSMEGSATDLEAIYIEKDVMAHANHYISPAMRRFELDRSTNANSIIRHNRAEYLLRENYGKLTPDLFRKLLADHAGYPTSICKHGMKV
jgi:isopenicillin-N N-acyltransferase-like protein